MTHLLHYTGRPLCLAERGVPFTDDPAKATCRRCLDEHENIEPDRPCEYCGARLVAGMTTLGACEVCLPYARDTLFTY